MHYPSSNPTPPSYDTTYSNGISALMNQQSINNALVTAANNSSGLYTTTSNGGMFTGSIKDISPAEFKLFFYKSHNGGFILKLMKTTDTYREEEKMFIIKDVENMGTEIQNILFQEILRG